MLKDSRFCHVIRTDDRNNVVFPHFDSNGLSGYELKNNGFTGFSRGGSKMLWYSSNIDQSLRLVICESAIDCLSHAQATEDAESAYASIGGAMSPEQRLLLQKAIQSVQERGGEVVSAVDRDKAGEDLHQFLMALGAVDGRPPDAEGVTDWNDHLQSQLEPVQARGLSM
jgi:hypothetical protein